MRWSRHCATAILFASAMGFTLPAAAKTTPVATGAAPVTIVDIGGLGANGGGPSAALGIAGGLVAGYAVTSGGGRLQNAVTTRGAGLSDIGAGLYGSIANAVNSAGIAAGSVFLSEGSQQRAVAFRGARQYNLGVLPGDVQSVATAINDRDVIVGTSTPAGGAAYVSQAFIYSGGQLRTIPPLRGLTGFIGANAQGINATGTVVGSVGVKGFFAGATSSYLFDGKTVTLFATIHGYGNSQATAINWAGTVVGFHSTFSFSLNAPLHAYAYAGGTLTDLGTLYPNDEFADSYALAINAAGQIVGYSQPSQGRLPPHATLFAHGYVTDLNTVLPANTGWLLEFATGIDDAGNIAGIGLHNGVQHGFILRVGAANALR